VPAARRRRVAARGIATLAAALLGPVAFAGTAYAAVGDYGSPEPMRLIVTLLVFVGIPLAAMILVGVFTLRGGRGVGAVSYRPGRPWGYEREWFGAAPEVDPTGRGAPGRRTLPGVGGASARW